MSQYEWRHIVTLKSTIVFLRTFCRPSLWVSFVVLVVCYVSVWVWKTPSGGSGFVIPCLPLVAWGDGPVSGRPGPWLGRRGSFCVWRLSIQVLGMFSCYKCDIATCEIYQRKLNIDNYLKIVICIHTKNQKCTSTSTYFQDIDITPSNCKYYIHYVPTFVDNIKMQTI